MKSNDERYSANSLVRGLKIITLFNDERPNLSLAEIASLLGVSRTVPYRLLYTLENLGYIRQDKESKRYELTPKVLELGYSYLNSQDLLEVAQPYLEYLRDELNLSSYLSKLDGPDVIYVGTAAIRGITAINVSVGLRIKAHAVANGRLLLAYQSDDYLEEHFNEEKLKSYTDYTMTDQETLRKDLTTIKEQGYSLSKGEFLESVNSIAVPIFNADKEVVSALSVVGPEKILNKESIYEKALPLLKEVAEKISNFNGYFPD